MSTTLGLGRRLRDFWHERRARARQSYDAARAEMGGAPWLPAPKSTDAWFVIDERAAPASLDQLRTRRSRRWIALGSAAGLAIVVVALISFRRPPVAAAPAAAIAAAPPAVAPPAFSVPAPSPPVAAVASAPAPKKIAHHKQKRPAHPPRHQHARR